MSVQPPWLPTSHRSELSMALCVPLASALPFRRHSNNGSLATAVWRIRTLQGEVAQLGCGGYQLDCHSNRACAHASCHTRFCSPLCVDSGELQGSAWPKYDEDTSDEILSVRAARAVLRPKRCDRCQAGHPICDCRASGGAFCGINVSRWCDRSSSKTEYWHCIRVLVQYEGLRRASRQTSDRRAKIVVIRSRRNCVIPLVGSFPLRSFQAASTAAPSGRAKERVAPDIAYHFANIARTRQGVALIALSSLY